MQRCLPLVIIILLFTVSGCQRNVSVSSLPTNQNVVATTSPTGSNSSSNVESPMNSADHKDGFASGVKEGRIWAKMPGQGMPYPTALNVMASGFAEKNGKKDNEIWKNGWVVGFESGFSAGRGGKVQLADSDPAFEHLTWKNISVGAKLYNNEKKQEASVISLDEGSGLINVKYAKSGKVEPKSLQALSQFWYIMKN